MQSTTKPNGYRFDDPLVVDFAICTLLLSGRKYYDFLHANSKGGLPSCRTVNRRIEELYPAVREGEINLTNLIYFLEKNNLEKIVCFSEDQTSIVSKIEYSDEFNSLVGYSYPLQENGLPDSDLGNVKTLGDIVRLMGGKYKRAQTVMVVMAQPIAFNAPAFRIVMYSSDGSFTAEDVKHRLETVCDHLKRNSIEALTYASDGDARELKFERLSSHLGWTFPPTGIYKKYLFLLAILDLK